MRHIKNFILERLNLNNDSRISSKKWTINNAKEGDIITVKEDNDSDSFFIFIFKCIEDNRVKCHGYYYSEEKRFEKQYNEEEYFDEYKDDTWNYVFYPSTEKEKEILYKAMKKASYKWNANKKQLEYV